MGRWKLQSSNKGILINIGVMKSMVSPCLLNTVGKFCLTMIQRANIEGSKSNVAVNAWLPQASYPCGNFSDTSCSKPFAEKSRNFLKDELVVQKENRDQNTIYNTI